MGVTVYCQSPTGVFFSVQVSAVTVPLQVAPIAWSAPVVAL
jgi:hypothetical protein